MQWSALSLVFIQYFKGHLGQHTEVDLVDVLWVCKRVLVRAEGLAEHVLLTLVKCLKYLQ